jgi:hypothetical protein
LVGTIRAGVHLLGRRRAVYSVRRVTQDFYFEKIRVFKAGLRLNTLAWNNKIGLWFYFCWFVEPGNG